LVFYSINKSNETQITITIKNVFLIVGID
jgi:hypothetical protein